jgi:hypothetical protein
MTGARTTADLGMRPDKVPSGTVFDNKLSDHERASPHAQRDLSTGGPRQAYPPGIRCRSAVGTSASEQQRRGFA